MRQVAVAVEEFALHWILKASVGARPLCFIRCTTTVLMGMDLTSTRPRLC